MIKRDEERLARGLANNTIAKRMQLKAHLEELGNKPEEIEEYLNKEFPLRDDLVFSMEDKQEEQKTETTEENVQEVQAEEPKVEVKEEEQNKPLVENKTQISDRELALLRKEIELEERAKYLEKLNAQLSFNNEEKLRKEQESIALAQINEKKEKERLAKEAQLAARKKSIAEALEAMESLDKEKAADLLLNSLTIETNSGNTNLDIDKEVAKQVQEQLARYEKERVEREFKAAQSRFLEQNKELLGDEDFVDLFNTKFAKESSKGASNFEAVFEKAKEQTLKVMPHLQKKADVQSNTGKESKPVAKISKELEEEAKKKNQAANIAVSGSKSAQGSGKSTQSESESYQEYGMKQRLERAARLRGFGKTN